MKKVFLTLLIFSMTSCRGYREDVRVVAEDIIKNPIQLELVKPTLIKASKKMERLMVLTDELGTFDFDKSVIEHSTITIGQIQRKIIDKIEGRRGKLMIVGHTDSIGSDQYNLSLSYRRARAVRDLILKFIPKENQTKIKVVGKGEKYPIVENNSVLNRRKNRRVEIFFIEE
ncbi:MAG: OmpA family protein [Psychrilyobacter sp.]|uniref:OmpA family protein n=1 Tax=Psychrilyobacter sp. TaxID=2586924 RepID=UPI003C73815E